MPTGDNERDTTMPTGETTTTTTTNAESGSFQTTEAFLEKAGWSGGLAMTGSDFMQLEVRNFNVGDDRIQYLVKSLVDDNAADGDLSSIKQHFVLNNGDLHAKDGEGGPAGFVARKSQLYDVISCLLVPFVHGVQRHWPQNLGNSSSTACKMFQFAIAQQFYTTKAMVKKLVGVKNIKGAAKRPAPSEQQIVRVKRHLLAAVGIPAATIASLFDFQGTVTAFVEANPTKVKEFQLLLMTYQAFAEYAGGSRNHDDEYVSGAMSTIVSGGDSCDIKRTFTTANAGTILVRRTNGKMVKGRQTIYEFVHVVLPYYVRAVASASAGVHSAASICDGFIDLLCECFDGREEVFRKLVDSELVSRILAAAAASDMQPTEDKDKIRDVALHIRNVCNVPVAISRRFLVNGTKEPAFVIDGDDGNKQMVVRGSYASNGSNVRAFPSSSQAYGYHGPPFDPSSHSVPRLYGPAAYPVPYGVDPSLAGVMQGLMHAAVMPKTVNQKIGTNITISAGANIHNTNGPTKEETERIAKEAAKEAAKETAAEFAKGAAEAAAQNNGPIMEKLDEVLASSKKMASASDVQAVASDVKEHFDRSVSAMTPGRVPSSAAKAPTTSPAFDDDDNSPSLPPPVPASPVQKKAPLPSPSPSFASRLLSALSPFRPAQEDATDHDHNATDTIDTAAKKRPSSILKPQSELRYSKNVRVASYKKGSTPASSIKGLPSKRMSGTEEDHDTDPYLHSDEEGDDDDDDEEEGDDYDEDDDEEDEEDKLQQLLPSKRMSGTEEDHDTDPYLHSDEEGDDYDDDEEEGDDYDEDDDEEDEEDKLQQLPEWLQSRSPDDYSQEDRPFDETTPLGSIMPESIIPTPGPCAGAASYVLYFYFLFSPLSPSPLTPSPAHVTKQERPRRRD